MQLQKLRVTQLSWKACSAKVEQLSQKMLCAWQELDTNGNCRVLSPDGTLHSCTISLDSWGRGSLALYPWLEAPWEAHSLFLFAHSQGDSGAPMVCANWGTRRLFQVGIFSWGLTSGSRGRPGMFVSVAQFVPWIQEETQKEGRAYILSGSPKSSLTCSPQGLLALGLGSQVLLAAMLS